MVIVDTGVWVDYYNLRTTAQTEWLDRELTRQPLALTDLIFCEVLQGFRAEGDFRRVGNELINLEIFESSGVLLAIQSAQNYRILRARGITVRKTIDCLIATFCIEHGHMLLHHDRDFDGFEQYLGLKTVHT